MKTNLQKYGIFIVILLLILITSGTSKNFVVTNWQKYKLDKEFVCPEKQTDAEIDDYLYRYTKFYMDNYPDMTMSNLLGNRINLLLSHDCKVTLENIAKNINGAYPTKESVSELKNTPYGPDNQKLKELES
ncbi:MAG: hypothetical protein M3Q34_02320 [bacterium]|nr:hypothetical protein [bacterium]